MSGRGTAGTVALLSAGAAPFLLALISDMAAAAPPGPPAAGSAADAGNSSGPASPADYGVTAPDPAPALPPEMDVFTPPLLGGPDGPPVAEFTRTAGPDQTAVVAGPDFRAGTHFRFYGQTTPRDGVALERRAHVASPHAASVVLPDRLPAWSTYLVWPGDGGVYGRPALINRTDAWWLGPDRPLAGDAVFLHGRNLAHDNGTTTAWVYLRAEGAAEGQWVRPTSVNPYRVGFTVPPLAPGGYEVWAHNGHGGQFGWSGPLSLTVISQSPWAGQRDNLFDVRKYGAVGDGTADDTAAVGRALDAAGRAAPATLYFPAGTYAIGGALELKDNVSWRGDGRDTSVIKVGPGFAARVPEYWSAFIYSDSGKIGRVAFERLTLDGADNLGGKSLVIFRHHDYVRLADCRFRWQGAVGGFNVGSNDDLTISGCEFVGDHVFLGDSRRVRVSDNHFRLTDFANAAVISWGGSEVSVTGNHAEDYDPAAAAAEGVGSGRFFVSQSHPNSNRHLYIADNRTVGMAPPVGVGDANQGEQILFEVGTSRLAAAPVAATPTTVTFAVAPPAAASQDAVVHGGRGAGQFRRVTGIEGNTVTVSPPWSVVPDSTSVVGVGPAQTRSVVYRNALDGKGHYSYETASVALSLYGNVSDVVFAGNAVTRMVGGLAAEFSQVPDPRTPTPSALYFNLVADNTLDGANVGVGVHTNFLAEDAPGLLGHLGNTYRGNRLRNVVSQGFRLTGDERGHAGGDLDQNVLEHNSITDVPTVLWVGKPRGHLNNPVRTTFGNVVLYGNTFERGTAAFAGSRALETGGTATTLWRAGNVWAGFEAGAGDPDQVPAARP